MASKLEWRGGKTDTVGFTGDLRHLLHGHYGRLYPHGVHEMLGWVLTPCIVHGDSYCRQEVSETLQIHLGSYKKKLQQANNTKQFGLQRREH